LSSKKPILVLGVGNLLLRDEGFGVHVARRLMEMDLPPDVEVMDGGTGGFDLLDDIEGRDKVVFIDVVRVGEEPGTLYRFGPEALQEQSKSFLSLHDIDVGDLLKLIDVLGVKKPEILVIGVEPKDMETASLELSPELAAQVPKVIELVRKEIKD
jgi:hydrogenase maturation protease